MSDSQGLGEQALNKAAEAGLASQLDEVENLDVNIKANPIELVQGKVEAVTVTGEGLVMQQDLRVETLTMEMASVAINPINAAFGKVELTRPTEASAQVVLTEADINRAFNSDYVRSQLQGQQINVNGQPVTVHLQSIDFQIPSAGKISLTALLKIDESEEVQQVAFSAVPKVSSDGQSVVLEDVEYGDREEISPDLTKALVNETSDILNLSNFDLPGMSLKVNHLRVEPGKLTLQADVSVEKIPTA
jgi:hypothetical protein